MTPTQSLQNQLANNPGTWISITTKSAKNLGFSKTKSGPPLFNLRRTVNSLHRALSNGSPQGPKLIIERRNDKTQAVLRCCLITSEYLATNPGKIGEVAALAGTAYARTIHRGTIWKKRKAFADSQLTPLLGPPEKLLELTK